MSDASDLVEGAIATARFVRLIRDDKITEPLRRGFFQRFPVTMATSNAKNRPGLSWRPIEAQRSGEVLGWQTTGSPLGRFVDDVLSCSWCLSVWAGFGIGIAMKLGPVGRFLVRSLAFSQLAVLWEQEANDRLVRRKVQQAAEKALQDEQRGGAK